MEFIQALLLALLAGISILDALSFDIGLGRPVVVGMIAGLIVGDVKMGLYIGGTLELLILGIGTYGGASIPNYVVGAIVGTYFAVNSKIEPEVAITTLAVPVGLLMVQLDILARSSNIFFARRAEIKASQLDFKGMNRNILLGSLPWALSRALPVFIVVLLGKDIVSALISIIPEQIILGMKVAGGLLPVVGIAILLRYMNTKAYIPYLVIGFAVAAYMKIPMLGVALIGLALGLIVYKRRLEIQNSLIDGGDYDE
jgi:PTS system mannose-specific IIC component